MELKDTIEMMISSDYRERFKAEYFQTLNRYEGLRKMLKAWDDGTLKFTPLSPRKVYEAQMRAMVDYLYALRYRAIDYDIDLTIKKRETDD